MPPSLAMANPLLAPVPCQGLAELVRLADGSQWCVFTVLHSAGMANVFLDAEQMDHWIAMLTEIRGKMSGLVLPRSAPAVPPALGPPNGHPG